MNLDFQHTESCLVGEKLEENERKINKKQMATKTLYISFVHTLIPKRQLTKSHLVQFTLSKKLQQQKLLTHVQGKPIKIREENKSDTERKTICTYGKPSYVFEIKQESEPEKYRDLISVDFNHNN